MNYLTIFTSTIILSYVLTLCIAKIANKLNIVDIADVERKKHKGRTPLLGGTAIFLSFFCISFIFKEELLSGDLETHHLIGVFIGALILIIGGAIDDKFKISAKKQIIFPIIACFSVILGGVEITKINSPLTNDFLYFSTITSNIFVFTWLICIMYTTKLLDGIDGLVSGVTGIGAFIIFIFTLTTKYYQPDISTASLILLSACLGFLILNWHPAKIFLGEGGSLFLGYILGVLAIISGGKVAIAALVLGIPITDMLWTIIRRLINKKNPLTSADRLHLHHRLNDLGLGPKRTATLYYLFSGIFGISAVFLQSKEKFFALLLLILIMIVSVIYLSKQKKM
ncbi:undecaprenyl/decaprenyl-phosphate alpha-N-acetylglucosaminyl 1-phosphate transferase [Patescibacteria group bacterium]|nr:undecaprenyl/decaprenyl-phosphate alpha-N-acetylglucosaminyl 1-phosphate transferase [Patescibacteria group bacterium]